VTDPRRRGRAAGTWDGTESGLAVRSRGAGVARCGRRRRRGAHRAGPAGHRDHTTPARRGVRRGGVARGPGRRRRRAGPSGTPRLVDCRARRAGRGMCGGRARRRDLFQGDVSIRSRRSIHACRGSAAATRGSTDTAFRQPISAPRGATATAAVRHDRSAAAPHPAGVADATAERTPERGDGTAARESAAPPTATAPRRQPDASAVLRDLAARASIRPPGQLMQLTRCPRSGHGVPSSSKRAPAGRARGRGTGSRWCTGKGGQP
jgi:hypothetical protein